MTPSLLASASTAARALSAMITPASGSTTPVTCHFQADLHEHQIFRHFTYRLREVKIGKAFLELIALVNRVLYILLVRKGLHLIDLAERRQGHRG